MSMSRNRDNESAILSAIRRLPLVVGVVVVVVDVAAAADEVEICAVEMRPLLLATDEDEHEEVVDVGL